MEPVDLAIPVLPSRAFAAATLPSRGIPRLEAPADEPWGLRAFALVDADGNLLRVGQVFDG